MLSGAPAAVSCSIMSLKNDLPMKIHVAKAKDLPLSWYELVLRPNKFTEHLETLRHNPEGESNCSREGECYSIEIVM